jgi:hypothetical protein
MDNHNLLLTMEEIAEIEKAAIETPALRLEYVFGTFGGDYKTIYKISPINGLIFIKGNEETGFEHIHSRHEFWSTNHGWKTTGNGNDKPDDPSRFSKKSIPIIDYVLISDSIYSETNINIDNNNNPTLYDLYIGDHCDKDGLITKYKLLTYKNSKIVHTLFPVSDTNNKKIPKKFYLKRGEVSAEEIPDKNLLNIKIPYINKENKTQYSILISKHSVLKLERLFILIHNSNGDPENMTYVCERAINNFDTVTKELMTYQYTDLQQLEKEILAIDKQLKEDEQN